MNVKVRLRRNHNMNVNGRGVMFNYAKNDVSTAARKSQ